MSQTVWSSINPASTSGTQLATILDDFKNAVMSGLTGTSRPAQTTAGGSWIDTTNAGSPNFYWKYMVYTGSVDVEVFRVNLSTGRASISGTDSTFEISRVAADSVGPLLKFLKERVASNGQLQTDDILGEIRFTGAASDDSNPTCATIQVIALENQTASASGVTIVFNTTPAGQTAAVEAMRIVGQKLGIGTTSPESSLHAHGTTGIKSSTASDDAVGAKITMKKIRTAGNGSVQASDVIGELDFDAKDSSGTVSQVAQIITSASEGHTSSAKGSIMKFLTTIAGGTTKASKFEIGDVIESKVQHIINALKLVSQDVATSATLNQVSGATAIVEFTGSTITSVRGINSTHASKVVLLHNRSSAIITIEHENANATAADRFKLPSSASVQILPDSSLEVFYDVTDTRWKVKSGAGTGGAGGAPIFWDESANAPEKTIENSRLTHVFGAGLAQELFTDFKVPASFTGGRQLKLVIKAYNADTSGNILLRAQSTLVRKENDDVGSTTNQRTTTNSAITMSASNDQEDQQIELDLTDSTGNINSVAVAAGDSIAVRLYRDTDTATSDVKLLTKQCEVIVA